MPGITVQIDGLQEVRRAMAATDRNLPNDLRREMTFEANVIVGHIKRAIPSKTGRAKASVRAVGSGGARRQITIDLKAGGARVPYFGWLEFGGQLPDKRPNKKKALASTGFGPVASASGAYRTKVTDGRYVRPTVRRHNDDLTRAMEVAFNRARTRAGL